MDVTMMQHNSHTTLSYKLSSVIQERSHHHRHSSSSSTGSPTISSPRRTVISTPLRRLSASPTTYDLQHRAITTLTTLYNNPSTSSRFISPTVLIERDDHDPLTTHLAFRDVWSQKMSRMPDFQLEVAEAVADEVQRKVWVRSEITGLPDGRRRESIDMMEFDENGILVATSGYWRTIKEKEEAEVEG